MRDLIWYIFREVGFVCGWRATFEAGQDRRDFYIIGILQYLEWEKVNFDKFESLK